MTNALLIRKRLSLQISEKKLAIQRYKFRLLEIEEEAASLNESIKIIEESLGPLEKSLVDLESNG